MIDLYTWSTPNGRKVSIMLEELGLPYRVFPIDIGKGDQFSSDFVKINPNSKIPAIVDHEGPGNQPLALFESGAILIYLADKTDMLLPKGPTVYYQTLQWLMFQMGGVGPMFGQAHHFRRFAPEKIPYAIERYTKEARRLYGVMDKQLETHEFLAGPYTIADVATFPWAARHEWHGVDLDEVPNVKRWYDTIAQRPAVKKGMAVP
ncbi:MAG: glutathione S-transferase N-terminal domain-containing protein [Alphaproteobacteria bacterium]|nr:glutathione S-transferase N-terminal domain-containing protein [Alphaproteobacteria bacterium]